MRALLVVAIAIAVAGCSMVEELLPQPPVMSREQAIAAAKAAEPDWADEQVLDARLGTWAELREQSGPVEGPQPEPDDAMWIVNLGWQLGPLNGQGVLLVLDARSGRVIQRLEWIS